MRGVGTALSGRSLSEVGPARGETGGPALDPSLRWLAAGGGATPEQNQVSIEQDLGLAAEVFGPGGVLLFAGGPGSSGVQVEAGERAEDPLLAELADLFAPRGGRGARYRRTTLDAAGPAGASEVRAGLAGAIAGEGAPLLVYLAGHGDLGGRARDNGIALWGGEALRVHEVAEALAGARRPVRLVVTSCFSGGFGELAFAGADPAAGAAPGDVCGLFAATWDLEASGCDPNPDRAAQEGYGIHFLHALRGEGRGGERLAPALVDFDGDGAVSLLEAHTRARVASQGIDVPTTTSERWLREVAPTSGPSRAVALPEEAAVIAHFRSTLGEVDAAAELERMEAAIDAARGRLQAAQADEDAAFRRLQAGLLARWPVLDDPWHPDFWVMFEGQREAIAGHLAGEPARAEYAAARARAAAEEAAIGEVRQRAAAFERLWRAEENVALAGRLAARGGPAWERYRRFLECERGRPPAAEGSALPGSRVRP